MKSVIHRELKSNKLLYKAESDGISGESNYTFGISLAKIEVRKMNEQIAIIQETNFLLKLLCRLFLNLIQLAPYEVMYKTNNFHKFRASVISIVPKISGKIGAHSFELRLHSGNICSLMKDDVQIAKFIKNTNSEFEKNIYEVYYSNEDDFDLCFLFCVLADVQWFKDDAEWHAMRHETVLVPFDNFSDRIHWMP